MNQVKNASANSSSGAEKVRIWTRIVTFFKEVIAEFKKVQRPTRQELWQIFLTVIFFVTLVMIFVGVFDLLFGKLVFLVFG